MQDRDNLSGALYMTVAMAAFTVNDSCMKLVTAELPLPQAILLRGLMAMAALALIGWRMGRMQLRLDALDARRLGLRSAAEVAATLTFLAALRHMPLANLSAIMQALPLAVTLGAALFLAEPVGWRRMSAIAAGFVGVVLIVRPGTDGFDIWSVLGLASVACVVLRDLATRRLSGAIPSVTVAFYAATAVTLAGAALVPTAGWAPLDLRLAGLILAAASFLIVGYLFIVMAMRVGEIGLVAPFRYTALVFAIALGWLVFGHLPDMLTLAGAAIVVATGLYTFHRERRLGRRVATPEKAPLRLR